MKALSYRAIWSTVGQLSTVGEIGLFLNDGVNDPVIRSQSPDLTVFDLNDAIEAAGDFGSFKKLFDRPWTLHP